jgi:hypothetical protein
MNLQQDNDLVQWAITTVLGVFAFSSGFVLKNIYAELTELKANLDKLEMEVLARAVSGDKALWSALESIRTSLDQVVKREEFYRMHVEIMDDRKRAAVDRENIAVMMASKNDLLHQLNLLHRHMAEYGKGD